MNTYYGNDTGIEILGANTGHGNYVGHNVEKIDF